MSYINVFSAVAFKQLKCMGAPPPPGGGRESGGGVCGGWGGGGYLVYE
jgi:hypothetical protein